jgi:hypothetical protein
MKFGFVFLLLIFAIAAHAQSPTVAPRPAPGIVVQFRPMYDGFFDVGEVRGKIGGTTAIVLRKPVFSDDAKRAGVGGRVRVGIVIAPDGTVSSAKAVSGPEVHYAAAERAALISVFKPTGTSIDGHLTYDFLIRKPNWFLVAFDLYAGYESNPGVIRAAFPEQWIDEHAIATKLTELIIANPRLDVPKLESFETRNGSSAIVTASVTVPPSPTEFRNLATGLRDKIRQRLKNDPTALSQFNLGERFVEALLARDPGAFAGLNALIGITLGEDRTLPADFVGKLRSFHELPNDNARREGFSQLISDLRRIESITD